MGWEMEPELEQAIGIRIRTLRQEKALTLDDLAAASGVSRAMISRIERAEASPTASLLARICAALGLSLSAFFAEEGQASPLAQRQEQQVWRDPETGYVRRSVSPRARLPMSISSRLNSRPAPASASPACERPWHDAAYLAVRWRAGDDGG